MSETGVQSYESFVLPLSIVTKLDVSRLLSEVERIDGEINSDVIRHKDEKDYQQLKPFLSDQLNDFLQANDVSLEHERTRTQLIKELRVLKDSVPVVHMTFATAADKNSLGTVVSWLRESSHPHAVVAVGLQPALVAGVYLRTPNHVYDFSLRARLKENHDKLVGALGELRGAR